MGSKKQNGKNKDKKTAPEVYNDQIGENASEEFSSEQYDNAKKNNKRK